MLSLSERVIGVLTKRGFDVSVVKENAAVLNGLLIDPLKKPRVICADTRVNSGDQDYTRHLKLIGGLHVLPAVMFGGTEDGYTRSAGLLSMHGVESAVHVGENGTPHDCKMFRLWSEGYLTGVYDRPGFPNSRLRSLFEELGVRTERLEGHAARDLIVNTIPGSTIDKAGAPRSLAVDQWFAEDLGIGDGHLDILAQAGEHLFKGEVIRARIIL